MIYYIWSYENIQNNIFFDASLASEGRYDMLTYNFENVSGPLYEHLYICIKNDINSGNLAANEKLPSKRTFAKNLGVSTITVENAYDQLISEGYVYALYKKGYYVADISGIAKIKPSRLESADIHRPAKKDVYEYDLSNNQTNPDNFPFSIWTKLLRETLSEKNDALMVNSPCNGIYELRAAIAEHLRSFRGMDVDPDRIVIGAGTEYLYGMLIRIFGKNKTYLVENPGHRKISQIYKSNDVKVLCADMDESGITVPALNESGADIVHISPTHHFPTGITMPASRRYELLAWANESSGRYIIEDDYDSEFRLNGKPIPTLQSIDINEKVIYMNTFSKSLASTIRISYMVLPVHLANRYYKTLSFYSCTVSNFEQYTLASFINRGYFEKHINRMRLYYARRRKQVLDIIKKSPLGDRCEIIEKDSGLHMLIRLFMDGSGHDLNESGYSLSFGDFDRKLAEKKIHITPMSEYYDNPCDADRGLYLINYSNLDIKKLGKALEIMAELLEL